MPPAKKRKTAAAARAAAKAKPDPVPEDPPAVETEAQVSGDGAEEQPAEQAAEAPEPAPAPETDDAAAATTPTQRPDDNDDDTSKPDPAAAAQDRMARFRALQARAKTSSDQNLKAATAESQRLAVDPSQLTAVQRQNAIASHKLLKADVEDAGGDFERKRAWDWTVDESERWDRRVRKREAHRDDNAFQDYRREAQKAYKRRVKGAVAPDLEQYTKDKLAAIEKAAASGSLEIVETEDGEMIAVDRDGSFYATADSTSFVENKPSKEAIDRLVNDQKKAEEAALKKRRERAAKNGDDADVTYINEKNKQFNQKLSRFYNKYTAEIRDSFERGTMI